jgi:hypothetical protein
MTRYTSGSYEAAENVLHLWYESPVDLRDDATVIAFFGEVETAWLLPLSVKPYVLVNYRNVRIAPTVTSAYALSVQRIQPLVIATYRYGVGSDLTGVTVTLGNMGLHAHANIFPDEASARAAIRKARAAAAAAAKSGQSR